MIHITGYYGLGDTLYQRPVVRGILENFEDVTIETAWPELFWDLEKRGLRFVKPTRCWLRTQNENIDSQPGHVWVDEEPSPKQIRLYYDNSHFKRGMNPLASFEESGNHRMNGSGFGLPLHPDWIAKAKRIFDHMGVGPEEIAIIRPPTVRSEWPNTSRNPDPEAFRVAVEQIRESHTTVSIGWLKEKKEWLAGGKIHTDYEAMHGELSHTTIAALVAMCGITIAPIGFLVPLACAVGGRAFFLFGGCNSPEQIFDDRMMQPSPLIERVPRITWVAPVPFCACLCMDHKCHKTIPAQTIINAMKDLLEE